mmetsp:Transcript_21306/g.27675  ORF Transcript_21306/g.27675 Transcript_21306/m.27675 type:complete len:422 (+) Transcript_21306:77-1342(+)
MTIMLLTIFLAKLLLGFIFTLITLMYYNFSSSDGFNIPVKRTSQMKTSPVLILGQLFNVHTVWAVVLNMPTYVVKIFHQVSYSSCFLGTLCFSQSRASLSDLDFSHSCLPKTKWRMVLSPKQRDGIFLVLLYEIILISAVSCLPDQSGSRDIYHQMKYLNSIFHDDYILFCLGIHFGHLVCLVVYNILSNQQRFRFRIFMHCMLIMGFSIVGEISPWLLPPIPSSFVAMFAYHGMGFTVYRLQIKILRQLAAIAPEKDCRDLSFPATSTDNFIITNQQSEKAKMRLTKEHLLPYVLSDRLLRSYYACFLESIFCVENLILYEKIHYFQNTYLCQEDRERLANDIVRDHIIDDERTLAVNLSSDSKSNILRQTDEETGQLKNVPDNMFYEIFKEVETLLVQNTCSAFLRSKYYEDFLEEYHG